MNIKSWYKHSPSPRIMLIFPTILIMLLSMWGGALALNYNSDAFAVVGNRSRHRMDRACSPRSFTTTDAWMTRMHKWFKTPGSHYHGCAGFRGIIELLALGPPGWDHGRGILGASTPKFPVHFP